MDGAETVRIRAKGVGTVELPAAGAPQRDGWRRVLCPAPDRKGWLALTALESQQMATLDGFQAPLTGAAADSLWNVAPGAMAGHRAQRRRKGARR